MPFVIILCAVGAIGAHVYAHRARRAAWDDGSKTIRSELADAWARTFGGKGGGQK